MAAQPQRRQIQLRLTEQKLHRPVSQIARIPRQLPRPLPNNLHHRTAAIPIPGRQNLHPIPQIQRHPQTVKTRPQISRSSRGRHFYPLKTHHTRNYKCNPTAKQSGMTPDSVC